VAADLQIAVDDDDNDDDLPSTPPQVNYDELPVYGVPPPDRVYLLEATLQELERGVFRRAALLVDSMLRDDRLNGTMQTRTNAVLGAPEEWSPANETGPAQTICDELQKLWPKICGPAEAAELLRWATMLGIGLGEVVWDRTVLDGQPRVRPRLKVWHPQFIFWRWDTRSYWLITASGAVEVLPGTGKWFILTPYGYNRAWLRGLVRSLARPWMQRCWTYRDAARRSEIYGQGIRQLITPAQADEKTKKRIEGQLANIGNETTLTTPQGTDGNKWDVKIVEASAEGFDAFLKFIKELNESIAINILGQNLTTQVSEGSRAAAKVHNQVRGDIMRFDAEAFARQAREAIFEPYCKFNYGDAELAPTLNWLTDPADDGAALAMEQLQTLQGLAIARQLKIPLDVRSTCELHQMQMAPGAPEVIELPEPEPPPQLGPTAKTNQPPKDDGEREPNK
jgi:phage gp29-like protein